MTSGRKQRINARLMNKTETARYLGLSVPTLNKLLKENKVPQPLKLSEGRWAWDIEKVGEWIEEQQQS